LNLTKKLFLLTSLVYAVDYFSSYFFHNFAKDIYEANPILRIIFETNNLILLVLSYLMVIALLFIVSQFLKFIAEKVVDRCSLPRVWVKVAVALYYSTFIILDLYAIIHNFSLYITTELKLFFITCKEFHYTFI